MRLIPRYLVVSWPVGIGVAAVIRDGGGVVLARRPDVDGGFWEFPGGVAGEGEGLRQALEREVLEGLGYCISAGNVLDRVAYDAGGRHCIIFFFDCVFCGDYFRESDGVRMVCQDEVFDFELGPSDLAFAERMFRTG
jgi:8-oxo-dGTP pyrophosphatase MutT (NUDIX family)